MQTSRVGWVLCAFSLALACSSSSGVDHSCGSSCANGVTAGSVNSGDPSYTYSENECNCGTPPSGAAEGAACSKGSDCAGTCCTCGTCGGRTYSASACVAGKCASSTQACQIALAHQSSEQDLCAQ